MKISFLASHGGSSARAIIAAIRAGRLDAEVSILVTNNRDSAIHQWCQDNGVEVRHISARTHGSEENADLALRDTLESAGTDLVVCSGYMKKIGPATLSRFAGNILNIHPALLPKHGGRGLYGDRVHAAVLEAGEQQSGATVHRVTAGYDEGPILKQRAVPVLPDDTVESLGAKVRAIEPGLYIEALEKILDAGSSPA